MFISFTTYFTRGLIIAVTPHGLGRRTKPVVDVLSSKAVQRAGTCQCSPLQIKEYGEWKLLRFGEP